MAMTVYNNPQASLALGELNKNISKVGNLLAKVSSGMKIAGAKDDSSQYSISEQMRVKIRALEQATQNIQNGGALLRTAEDGIQQQIEMVRTIKEKVIDAANDTNTDDDRLVIQKEINQLYDQIEQTAYYTDYNTHKPLVWQRRVETHAEQSVEIQKTAWSEARYIEDSEIALVPGSSLNIINRDNIATLDGQQGPFDTFSPYHETNNQSYRVVPTSFDSDIINANNKTGDTKQLEFYGGSDDGTAAILKVDFADYENTITGNTSTGLYFKGYDVNGNLGRESD